MLSLGCRIRRGWDLGVPELGLRGVLMLVISGLLEFGTSFRVGV